jgi:N-acetylmuramoyl-L-alanine amidase
MGNGPILVIDAGHGGEDGGAVSLTGVHESTINLDIALKMAALAELTGIDYVLTRDSEELSYPEDAKTVASRKKFDQNRRLELINGTPNAVLLSIHQNCYPHKSPHGPQAFYAADEDSKLLAELTQAALTGTLSPGNRRLAVPVSKTIYLFKYVNCPAALVECGFISNPEESKLLDTDAYRLRIAVTLTGAYFQYLDTKDQEAL